MRYLLLIISLLPFLATAQISTSLQDGGYYYVVVEGDTVSHHTRVDKAMESASEYPEWEIVQDFRLSGSSLFYDEDIVIEEVTDTVYVDPDVYESLLLHDIQWGTSGAHDSTHYELDVSFQSAADKVDFELVCGTDLITQGGWMPQTTGRNGFVEHTFTLSCGDDIQIHFEASTSDKIYSTSEVIPAFALQITEAEEAFVDSVKKKTDINMAYLKITNDSLLWTNDGHDNAVFLLDHSSVPSSFWDDVSANGGNLRVYYWDGSQEIAVAREVVDVDTVNETGAIFFDSSDSQADTANEWRVYAEDGATEPASTDPLGSEAVWSNKALIDHKADGSDSSPNSQPSSVIGSPTTVNGKFGNATQFNGVDQLINYGQGAQFSNEIVSVSVWAKADVFENFGGVIGRDYLVTDDGFGIYTSNDPDFSFQARDHNTNSAHQIFNVNTSDFYHLVGVKNNDEVKFYANGSLVKSETISLSITPQSDDFAIGNGVGNNAGYFDGIIQEARLINSSVSENYIETEYNNQSDPDAFWTVELVEEGGSIEGGSDATLQINSTGSGEKEAFSGADSTLEISTTQAGQKLATGGAATEIIIDTSQAGEKRVTGGSDTAISITAVGVGTALEVASGGSDASISISAAADGFKRALAGANATVRIVGEGAGEKSISSGSDAMVLIATNGQGEKRILSGSQAEILISAFGAGFVESEFEIAEINFVLKQNGMEGIFKTGTISGVFHDND